MRHMKTLEKLAEQFRPIDYLPVTSDSERSERNAP